MSIKDELAPKGIHFNPGDFVVSDKYATILTVISFPQYISPGYLASLTSMSGIKVVIKHIPLPSNTIQKMLNKQLADLNVNYQAEKDNTMRERIRQQYESLESFVQMIALNQSRTFDFQLHIMVTADTKEELEIKKLQVKNYLQAMQLRAVPMRFEQEKVFKSILPIYKNQDIEERIGTPIPSVTMAAMYPFIFDSIKDEGLSALLGVDFSGGVILFNQFLYQIKKENNRNNANMIILGTSGSGKSTSAKVVLRSHIRNGHKVVCIDPEGELEEMVKLYKGDFIDLGKGGEFGMVNPLEIIADADEDELKEGLGRTVMTKTLQSLKAFMKYYDPSMTEDVLTVFIGIVMQTYQRFGITFETDFTKVSRDQYPIFSDVYATAKGKLVSVEANSHEHKVLEQLELKLRPLVRELRYYFDGHTTIKTTGDFITFNIKEFMNSDKNIRNALFFNILKYAWGLCLDKRHNTVMTVDEAHVLLGGNNTLGAEFLAQMQRRARKYNTGTIIITQQPSDFAAPDVLMHGKAIFDNASYYLVMGLKKQAVEDLSKLVDLNDNEKESIKRYNQGEALFVCGSRRMRIKIIVTPEELESIGSGGGL